MKILLIGIAVLWFSFSGNQANANSYRSGPIFNDCYLAETSMQVDFFLGRNQITSTTWLRPNSENPPEEVACPVATRAKQFLFKWDNRNRIWSICSQTESFADDTGFTPGEVSIFTFSRADNELTCGIGYYLNYSHFCAQYEPEGAWACEGRRSDWLLFPARLD